MPARFSAFVIWALVAGSLAFWGMRLSARAPQAPAHAVPVAMELAAQGDLGRVLGAAPVATAAVAAPPPEIAARFKLTGIMAAKPPATEGIALITIDGKLPRAFQVGAPLDDQLVLQSVSLRSAAIGPAGGPPVATLELPLQAHASTGTLPPPARLDSPRTPPPPAANASIAPRPGRPAPPPGARPAARQ